MFDTLVKRIQLLAEQQPDKPAVIFKKEQLTYAELNQKMVNIAGRLSELGVKRGDRVSFSATSKPEMAAVYLAIQYLGAVAVFIDKNAAPGTAAKIYKDAGSDIFFTDKPLKEFAEACRTYSLKKVYTETGEKPAAYELPGEDDLAELIYTSGTTGEPKGCMLTYKAVYNIWMNTINGIGMRDDDIVLLPLPLNHSFALRVFRACLYLGATVVLQNGFTFAQEIEKNLDAFHCTAIAIVPASVETITKQMQDKFTEIMSRFRYIEVSAGSLTVEQRKRLTKQLPNTVIHNTWGSSESGGALFLNVTEEAKTGEKIAALGKPLEGVEVRTVDEDGNPFRSSEKNPGRMTIRGDMQMAGYWNKPELSAKTLKDGWLLTGDMIYIDDDGYLYMLGRADDIINVGGEKVSPIEVENTAGEYENIAECACIGVPDPEGVLGWVPVMYVVTRNSRYSEEELRNFLASRLERQKIPVKFIELFSLPRNAMQKIDRKALKALWESQGDKGILNETIQTIMTRRSVRKFTDQPVSRDILDMILTAGYYAPSGHNMQTWRFTVVRDPEKLQQLKAATKAAAEENGVYFYGWENPQAMILVSNDNRNPYGCQDSSAAVENIMLAAWSYGIGAVWLNPMMTLRNKQPLKEVLDSYGIPENHTVWSAVALGYPVSEGMLLKKKTDVIVWAD